MAVVKRMTLNLDGIPTERRQEAKEEVAQLFIDATLESVSRGESPVAGEGSFERLSSEYADREKGGNRTANMELSGDMLDELSEEISPIEDNWIEIGIRSGLAAEKAESHNHHSGAGRNPRRRFIPGPSQVYSSDIMRESERILERYRSSDQPPPAQRAENTSPEISDSIDFNLATSNIFGGNRFLAALRRAIDDIEG